MTTKSIAAPLPVEQSSGLLESLRCSEWYRSLACLQSEFSYATHNFFRERGLLAAMLPVVTDAVSSPCGLGSDSHPMAVQINGREWYLADSMQFLLEVALRLHNKGVYYIMPSFRGDSVDSRHLCQFFHAEAEIFGTLQDVMSLVAEYVHHLSHWMLTHCGCLIEQLAGDCRHVESVTDKKGQFPQVRFEEALTILHGDPRFVTVAAEGFSQILPRGEQRLIEVFGGIVWLTHMPWALVPFYQQPEEGTPYSLSADLLLGIGETVGSGQRVPNEVELLQSMDFHQVDKAPYHWYLELKRRTPAVTAGFGMGMERFLLWLTSANDIRHIPLCLQNLTPPFTL
jgi:asparaginyl-tRNA synthetase